MDGEAAVTDQQQQLPATHERRDPRTAYLLGEGTAAIKARHDAGDLLCEDCGRPMSKCENNPNGRCI